MCAAGICSGLTLGVELNYADWAARLPGEDIATVEAAVTRALDPVDELACDYCVRRRDGILRWVSALVSASFEADPGSTAGHRPVLVQGTIQNVTLRHAAAAALACSNELARGTPDAFSATRAVRPDIGRRARTGLRQCKRQRDAEGAAGARDALQR